MRHDAIALKNNPPVRRRPGVQGSVIYEYVASVLNLLAQQYSKKSALSTTGGTDNAKKPFVGQTQIDVLENLIVVIALTQILDVNFAHLPAPLVQGKP